MINSEPQYIDKKIGNYLIGKTIGQGTFGKVKLGTHILTGQLVAIKILLKQKIIDVPDVQRVTRQLHILRLIRHPNIIQLYQVLLLQLKIIQTKKLLFLVMQYIENGQLFQYIVSKNKIDEIQACKLFKQIISGVQYLHHLKIVHRDLKPQNLLLDYKKSLKIVDFGLSNTYKDGQKLKTACGSPCYAAPQMIANKSYNPINVDIWSCGVILFAMVCGYLPFQQKNTSDLYKKILAAQFTFPQFVSKNFKDLVNSILKAQPQLRFSFDQILKHQWCKIDSTASVNSGIIVGYHRIPVDNFVLQKLKDFNIEIDHALRCIQANKQNHITTTYYLILQKMLKSGYQSNANLANSRFDYQSVKPYKSNLQQYKYSIQLKEIQDSLINIHINDIELKRHSTNKTPHIKSLIDNKQMSLHRYNNYTHDFRKSPKNIDRRIKGDWPMVITSPKKSKCDLNMYLSIPKKRQYYSVFKSKQSQRFRIKSLRSQPKTKNQIHSIKQIKNNSYAEVFTNVNKQTFQYRLNNPLQKIIQKRKPHSKFRQLKISQIKKINTKLC